MGSDGVVLGTPVLDQDLGFLEGVEDLAVEQLISKLAVEALAVATLPRTCWLDEQRPDGQAIQPFPYRVRTELRAVSERMCSGSPLVTNSSANDSMKSVDRSFRSTTMSRHSRVYSSMSVSMRNALPSWVRSTTRSYAQTWFGYCGRSRMHEPSLSHSLPRFGCF